MKCKLQQPVKEFIIAILAVAIVILILTIVVTGVSWLVGFATIQSDICIVGEKVFHSPAEVYLIQGIVINITLIFAGLFIFATGSLIFSVYSFVKFLVRAIFIKGKERDWFKENIYNCEGKE